MTAPSSLSLPASPTLPGSLWAATASPAPRYSTLDADATCDTVIIGGGFTGLSTALHLAKKGQRVIVAEAAEPGWGASGRNGGQIIAGLKADPETLIGLFGADFGMRVAKNMGLAAELVFDLIETYQIDCHARRGGWLQAAHGPKPLSELIVSRYEQWKSLGVACELLTAQEVSNAVGSTPDAYVGGWRDSRGGTLQPLSYARGLARAAVQEGALVCAHTPARGLRRIGKNWEVDTGRFKITAKRVVIATNAYTTAHGASLIPALDRSVIPVTSFQMATEPLAAKYDGIMPGGVGVTDSRRLLLYFRRDHTGRLIMGGRSPVDDDPSKNDAKSLQRAIRRIFPQLDDCPVDFVWSGKVAITKDKLPHIHMPEENLFAFIGCNGRGVAICSMMGKLLADLASGTPAADIPFPITAPQYFTMHRLRRLGIFALSKYYEMLDRLEAAKG